MDEPSGKRVFKILSIDGGGIKGLYTAAVLNELEKKHAIPSSGNRLGDYFDMIAGTSTGALIASAIASGKTCEEVLNAYRSMGQEVFPDTSKIPRMIKTVRQMLIGARYSNEPVRKALNALVGDTTFSQAKNYLVIPVTNITNYKARVFKNKYSSAHTIDDCRLSDIALASAAAPTYFPLVKSPDKGSFLYADGGLVANNPVMIAALDALAIFVGPESERNTHDSLAVLSLGTYGSPNGFWFDSKSKSMLGWMWKQKGNIPLIGALMDGQTGLAHTSTMFLQRGNPKRFVRYERRDAVAGISRSTPQNRLLDFELSDARSKKLLDLESFGAADGQADASDPNIAYFFKEVKNPIHLFP
jgi:predicted acylesterase/phospholipase RssA